MDKITLYLIESTATGKSKKFPKGHVEMWWNTNDKPRTDGEYWNNRAVRTEEYLVDN